MTIKEACVKVLNELGGRAPLKIICMMVQEIVVFKGATPYNSICTELINHPKFFRRTEGRKGWWELVSYQEELTRLKQVILDRDNEINALKDKVETLEKRQTVGDFVKQEVKTTEQLFMVQRGNADPVRQVLGVMGFSKEAEELAAWIEHKENRLADAVGKLAEKPAPLNYIDKNYGPMGNVTEQHFQMNGCTPAKQIE